MRNVDQLVVCLYMCVGILNCVLCNLSIGHINFEELL